MKFNLKKFLIIFVLFTASPALAAPQFEYAFSPRQGGTELVVKTIKDAKQSILVAAYSFTSRTIAEALVEAQGRGVDVKIVMDKGQSNDRNSLFSSLKNKNLSVRLNAKYAAMHDKFMVIDGQILELGSFNYTWAAETKNAENVLVIKDAGVIAQDYARQWQKLWDEAE